MFPHDHPLPLHGKTALVTGVSRRRGIGFAVASRFARLGASVFIHHFRPHDTDLPWGGDDLDALRAELRDALTPERRSAMPKPTCATPPRSPGSSSARAGSPGRSTSWCATTRRAAATDPSST
nr:hypothetical protein GCM10025699_07420 [Microbacterium flavescens]